MAERGARLEWVSPNGKRLPLKLHMATPLEELDLDDLAFVGRCVLLAIREARANALRAGDIPTPKPKRRMKLGIAMPDMEKNG